MRTRSLSWDEDEVRKKKTLILVLAFLLIPLLLGLYAAVGPEGGLIAGATPTALLSPSAVATATVPVPAFTATATPTASATPVAKATATPVSTPTPVPPEPSATPVATSAALEPSATPVVTSVALEPTATPVVTSVALEPTATPTVALTATLAAPVVTTPPDGSVLKDDQPTIAGTAPLNTTVQVYDDGSLVGTATADAQGDWAWVPGEPLEPGEHAVTAVASDESGRTSAPSGAVTLTVVIEHLPVTGGSWSERWLDRLFRIVFH
jgi:hypothetical protein